MAKKNSIERALRGARRLVSNYIRPGAETAEQKIDELLTVLAEARRELKRQRKRFMRRGGKSAKRKSSKRSGAAARGAVKRRVKSTAKRKKRS